MFKIWKRDQLNNNVITANLEELLHFLKNTKEIECDTETTGLCPHLNDILCAQFGNPDEQYLVQWTNEVPKYIKDFLKDNNKTFIFHNAKFDLQFLYKYDLIVENVYDTFIAEAIISCGNKFHRKDLASVSERYLGVNIDKTIRGNIAKLGLTNEVISYGLDDVKYLSLIKAKQLEIIEKYELERALSLDNKFVKTLAYIEFCGLGFNRELWQKNIDDNIKIKEELLLKMNELVIKEKIKGFYNYADLFSSNAIYIDGVAFSTTINWDSPKQVANLFNKLGIDIIIEDEDGEIKYSVGKSKLQDNKGVHPIVDLFSEYSKNNKLLSSFGSDYYKFVNPVTNRIHSRYTQILNTGRMSSQNPNLQQLPSDPRYRKCFVPEKGNSLIAADYSGMESVVFANMTLDENLLKFYDENKGADMH